MTNATQTTTPEIVKRTIEQATRLLDASNTEYIIRLRDGTVYTKGDMELVTTKTRTPRQARKMPHGSYTNAYKQRVVNMKVGDVLELALTPEMIAAGVTLLDVQGTISTIASTAFGKDAHKICANKSTGCNEILRTA